MAKDAKESTHPPKEKDRRTCFVIAPIGAPDSEERRRSDQVLKHIISPAAKECGYDTVRADQISEPGMITSQVIQHVVQDPLVIADLTGRNPNVFYELAIRHAVHKPVVQIINASEKIPFDVAQSRTVHVDHHDLDSAARAREEIVRQIVAVEKNPGDVDTPISVAVELQALRESDNPLEKSNAEIIAMLQEMRAMVGEVRESSRYAPLPQLAEEMSHLMFQVRRALDVEEGKEPTREQLQKARDVLRHADRMMEALFLTGGANPAFFRRRARIIAARPEPAEGPKEEP
jgi:hypothetical protein